MIALAEHFEEENNDLRNGGGEPTATGKTLEPQLAKVIEALRKVCPPDAEYGPAASSFAPDMQMLASPIVLPDSASQRGVVTVLGGESSAPENLIESTEEKLVDRLTKKSQRQAELRR